jgi:hypothetical protein
MDATAANTSPGVLGLGQEQPASGKAALAGGDDDPNGGQRSRTKIDSFSPSIEPGMSMSVNSSLPG